MNDGVVLNSGQIAVIRTLWELAQGKIDELYSVKGAEEEKQAIEDWITITFSNEYKSIVRSESLKKKFDIE
jgi:hypothetical protein